MSYLPPKVESGQKAVVSGQPFTVTMQTCPELKWEVKATPSSNGSL